MLREHGDTGEDRGPRVWGHGDTPGIEDCGSGHTEKPRGSGTAVWGTRRYPGHRGPRFWGHGDAFVWKPKRTRMLRCHKRAPTGVRLFRGEEEGSPIHPRLPGEGASAPGIRYLTQPRAGGALG